MRFPSPPTYKYIYLDGKVQPYYGCEVSGETLYTEDRGVNWMTAKEAGLPLLPPAIEPTLTTVAEAEKSTPQPATQPTPEVAPEIAEIPKILLIKCESRRMERNQPLESMWFLNSMRQRDILSLVHNRRVEDLTQLALLAGHDFYLDLLTSKAGTWWEGDILDDQGEMVAKAPSPEVLSLIREIPSHYLMRPEELKKSTPSFLGKRLFNFVSKGGFTVYTKECDCKHCAAHTERLHSDPDYLWYI